MFLENYWYVAAYGDEVSDEPLARTICNQPVVLFRQSSGEIAALLDICPHRLVSLSLGSVEGDYIRCRYHGIEFDGEGRCVRLPGAQGGGGLKVERVFPVVECYGFAWVWIGDPAKADPALLPDFWWLENPEFRFTRGAYHIKCDYRLVADNLLDLTHEAYVHPETIGQSELFDAPLHAGRDGNEAYLEREMTDVIPARYWAMSLGYEGPVDRWQRCRFKLPSIVLIDSGVAKAGTGALQGDRSQGVTGQVINFITPETERTCRYFVVQARDFLLDLDAGGQQQRNETLDFIVGQDVAILEDQQRLIDAYPDMEFRSLRIDMASTHARRIIDEAAAPRPKAA
ncbi:MAG: aromatic ring-hydroxylating dioxygenase subunit alpha [Proteobacteria bacterium]|nr:aromatic ring-hydroxylating dioxygenase subunit alpha [Pseudomonadota bacterium]